MRTIEQLIKASRDTRLQRQPRYVQDLVDRLTHRLVAEHRHALAVQEEAEKEVTEARAALTEGPADSDTFLALPSSPTIGYTEEMAYRPLGRGTAVEFRPPGTQPGEGFYARLDRDGCLQIDSDSSLAVYPVNHLRITVGFC